MALTYLKNVTTLKLDRDLCIGCGLCVEVCPHGVLSMENKKAKIIDKDLCMECGGCAKNCPVNAIFVRAGVGCATAVLKSKSKKGGASNCGDSAKEICCG